MPRTPKIRKPVKMGVNTESGGIRSAQFTNAEDMKNRFFNNAANRRKAGDKAHGDAGYWTGGRCNWGGFHNLQEDWIVKH